MTVPHTGSLWDGGVGEGNYAPVTKLKSSRRYINSELVYKK